MTPYTITLDRMTPEQAGAALAKLVATSATCPTCGAICPVYHDKAKAAYYQRHMNQRGAWCKMSGKKVE